MPTGHFSIGDLSFTVEGSLKELAHCQEIIREINEAEYRLTKASGSDDVKIIYDDNLEGESGTFDKMRLRAYDDTTNYTLDIGSTDTNPLGIYVGRDQNIDVYDRDTQENWEITPEGEEVGKPSSRSDQQGGASSEARSESTRAAGGRSTGKANGSPQAKGTAKANGTAKTKGSPGASKGQADPSEGKEANGGASMSKAEALDVLVKQASVHPDHHLAGNVEIGPGEEPLDRKIRAFARFCGRSGDYLERVAAIQEFDDAAELKVGEVEETLQLIYDEETLEAKEQAAFG